MDVGSQSSKDGLPFWEGIVLKLNTASEDSRLSLALSNDMGFFFGFVLYWHCLHEVHMAQQELCPQGSGAWWNHWL